MTPNISGSTQQYLDGLQNIQNQLSQAQAQLSSGYRLQNVSDDPSAISPIYEYETEIALNQQTQTNISGAQTEVQSADTALQSAIQQVTSAISLASQAGSATLTASDLAAFAQQAIGIQQEVIGLSQTQVNGNYIFSGDQPGQPVFQYDASQPQGVQQLISPTSTRTIVDTNGTAISDALTAQQIFDPLNSDGTAASGNVFDALNSLVTALQNNDQAGVATASSALTTASEYLNGQLAFYGTAENRLTDATNIAQKFLTLDQSSLGQVQDTDVPTAALELTQAQTQQQAALSVEAKIQQAPDLFNYLS
jgi:flagellar hook-associated protein 3 FlgL